MGACRDNLGATMPARGAGAAVRTVQGSCIRRTTTRATGRATRTGTACGEGKTLHPSVLVEGVGQRRGARPRLVQTQCWCPRDVGCRSGISVANFFSVQFRMLWSAPREQERRGWYCFPFRSDPGSAPLRNERRGLSQGNPSQPRWRMGPSKHRRNPQRDLPRGDLIFMFSVPSTRGRS